MSIRKFYPLVSVVTPAYNAERFIEETLKSVMNQTYPNIEHIVIDDGSTDKTPEILNRYENLYNLKWFSKPNEGQAITVNKGFDLAKGDIVIWLNADDVLFSRDVIAKVVDFFLKNPAVDVAYGHMAIIDEKSRLLKIQYAPPKLTLDVLLIAHPAACIFYKRHIVHKYKLNHKLNFALDYDQCLRMAKDGVKFGRINKILIAWRKHSGSKSLRERKKLLIETKKLRSKYDYGISKSRMFSVKVYLYAILLFRKLYGVTDIIKLYSNPDKFQLAFDIKFDSLMKLLLRQIIPYV